MQVTKQMAKEAIGQTTNSATYTRQVLVISVHVVVMILTKNIGQLSINQQKSTSVFAQFREGLAQGSHLIIAGVLRVNNHSKCARISQPQKNRQDVIASYY
eukprot:3586985-Amphidinium_carterae.1